MDYVKYILVFVVLFVHIEAGGQGGQQHDHVKVVVPKFINYDHHTKLITIHHHHHKPKKEHHHHHHHHHKPKAPHDHQHHYHHHHKKTTTHSVSKGHSSHGKLGSHRHNHAHDHHGSRDHHGSQGHRGHHGNHGHGPEHKHHDIPLTYDPFTVNYEPPNYAPPTVNYAPPSVNYSPSPSYGNDFKFVKSAPAIPGSPKVRGVVHTVKQTKVFDSLPNAFPEAAPIKPANTGLHGYEITEQEDVGEDDVFTAVNSLSQTYPSTYGFVRNAAPDVNNDPFAEIPHQSSIPTPNDNVFQAAPNPTPVADVNSFTSQSDPFQSSIPNQGIQPAEFPSAFEDSNTLTVQDPNSVVGISSVEDLIGDTPVTFNREAGIQQTINTGGVESFVY